MVELSVTAGGIRAFDRDPRVSIDATDWSPAGGAGGLPAAVDATVSGSASRIHLPGTVRTAMGPDGSCDLSEVRRLPDGDYLLSVEAGVAALLRFSGGARVDPGGDGLTVEFDGRRAVTLGLTERPVLPRTVRVPESPEGVAAALTHAAATADTTGPERSHPTHREHPPLLAFGDSVSPEVRASTPDTGVELELPRSYGHLFATAPLAYYAGATVRVGAGRPVLRLPGRGVTHTFDSEGFADGVAGLLRRLFFLDCYARETDREGRLDPPVPGVASELDEYAGGSMAERVAMALDGHLGELDPHLPEWHLVTYVEGTADRAPALPYLLDRLSLVYPPSASELDGQALLKRTLDDFYRGQGEAARRRGPRPDDFHRAGGEVATADRLDPDLRDGGVHAWLAEGIPVAASKASLTAYRNRLRHRTRPTEGLRVDVVLNDEAMDEERPVADIYRERAADLPVEVRVHESLSRAGLAGVFESSTDFVHYVGHCEVDGLKCSDGYLPAAGLDVGARTFFLNACGSYREGLALVDGGAAAGAVTLTKVLNEQAARVGTAFARLLIGGFGIERAMSLARRRILMGQDYAVVGDGTYTLAPADGDPALVRVSGGPDRFDVVYRAVSGPSPGAGYRAPFTGHNRLRGTDCEAGISRSDLVAFLRDRPVPVLYEGEVHWGPTFAARLD